jgi:hypothetical protein
MLLFVILNFIVVKSIIFKLILLVLFILSIATGLLTYLINPGITFKENDKEGNNHYCHLCKFKYPKSDKKYEHCSLCEICIPGADHHCGVFEKCIGKKKSYLLLFISCFFHYFICCVYNFYLL